jgi:hypothetical protein
MFLSRIKNDEKKNIRTVWPKRRQVSLAFFFVGDGDVAALGVVRKGGSWWPSWPVIVVVVGVPGALWLW